MANLPFPAPSPERYAKPVAKRAHDVQFYEDDTFLLDTLAAQMVPVLEQGGAVVVLATKLHRDGLTQRLKQRGFDIAGMVAQDRFIRLDAQEVKQKICRNGRPDASRFQELAGGAIRRAARENGHTRRVLVFGEVVAELWQEGRSEAAIELEYLWNQLQEKMSFDLLCAYPMHCFSRRGHDEAMHSVCQSHTHVAPAESYGSIETEEQRLRVVAKLQQQARALETEARLNEERMDMVQAAAGLGTMELDLTDETLALSNNAQRMLGLAFTGRAAMSELLRVMYYSGDRDTFQVSLKKVRTGRKEFTAVFRVKVGDEVRIFSLDGRLHYNSGQPLLLAVLSDVTAARNAVA